MCRFDKCVFSFRAGERLLTFERLKFDVRCYIVYYILLYIIIIYYTYIIISYYTLLFLPISSSLTLLIYLLFLSFPDLSSFPSIIPIFPIFSSSPLFLLFLCSLPPSSHLIYLLFILLSPNHSIRVGTYIRVFIFQTHPNLTPHKLTEWMVEV